MKINENKIIKVYAKVLSNLCFEHDIFVELEAVYSLIYQDVEIRNVLLYDTFSYEDKILLLNEIASSLRLAKITQHILIFLLQERRIQYYCAIFKWMERIINERKLIYRCVVEGPGENFSNDAQAQIEIYLRKHLDGDFHFTYRQNINITAGYHIILGDLELDATIDKQFEELFKLDLGSKT